MPLAERVSQGKLWNLNITHGSQEVKIRLLCQVRNDRPWRKNCTLIYISSCSVLSGGSGGARDRPGSVAHKWSWTVCSGSALCPQREAHSPSRSVCGAAVPCPFGGHRAAEPTVPSALCIQLSVPAKKRNKLACKELHAAAATLQWVPELLHLHTASLPCSSGYLALKAIAYVYL